MCRFRLRRILFHVIDVRVRLDGDDDLLLGLECLAIAPMTVRVERISTMDCSQLEKGLTTMMTITS